MSWTLLFALEAQAGAPAPVKPLTAAEQAAAAQEPADGPGVSLWFRGVGEVWDDPEIGRVYRSSALMVGAGLVVPVHEYVQVDLEGAYQSMSGSEIDLLTDAQTGSGTSMEIVPLSVLVEGRMAFGDGSQMFFGVGPTATLFKEESSVWELEDQLVGPIVSGTKLGGEARLGVRLATGILASTPDSIPRPGPQVDGLHVELYAGRRFQKAETGFDLAAWRGTFGLGVQF
ncbi:MAG: hypothetical protein GY913_32835 [Proteobacteria bacterium]|nr:hypothetical protein [Pseudomonadota bacterium]MCP4921710.1 hypothetical protein [Pseudomonadota bacterium]